GKGTQPRQAWLWALITHQRRLWAPLLVCTAVLLMGVAYAGSGSRGGTAALLLGLSVTSAGMARGMRRGGEPGRAMRWAAASLVLGVASAAAVALWLAADGTPSREFADVSLPSRLALSVEGSAIVRDHPLFGTGLGSWLHAFRPYQAPPVEGGIWDHAHNDYLEAAAENGVVGVALMMLFALAVLRATRREQPVCAVQVRHGPHEPATEDARGCELPEWRAALGEHALLRCGLAGGVALAEEGDRGRALALVVRALDRSPANLEGHEALATALGQDSAAEAALRRALVLSPWSPEVRDRLALQLWARGARQEGAAEL